MIAIVSDFLHDESGATGVEYALIGALISVMIAGGASAIGSKVGGQYANIAARLP